MVLTSGGFDGLHAGHVLYLEAAKALCDEEELHVCAVAPDRYLASKGRPPRWTQHERVRTIRALECVDAAVAQGASSVADLIREYRPRMFVKGPDWQDRLPEDVQRACTECGTAMAFVDTPGRHVSETIPTDDEALARFEALVLSQQPAETPWEPVTDYSFEARKDIEGPHAELIEEVFQPKRALDYGAGYGHLVRLLREVGVTAFGYEPYLKMDPAAGRHKQIYLPDDECAYDLVICREVLEHLPLIQFLATLHELCELSSRFVYVTTRFAKAPTHLLDVDTSDDLDPTHITMLHQTFLRTLFVLEGFKRRADLEERLDWQHKGRVLVYERP